MNDRHFVRAIATCNFGVALLAAVWAYASYKYNWLNVGGGIGDVDVWDQILEIVPVVASSTWVAAVLGAVMLFRSTGAPTKLRFIALLMSVVVGPAILGVTHWFFHRGFPISPV